MVGTMLSMMGATNQANAEEHAHDVKAGIDFAEARANQENVVRQLEAGRTNEAQQLGSVRAAYGASGVQLNGSAALTLNSQAGVMNSKIAAASEEGTLKTNVLITEGNAEMRAGQDAETGGLLKAGALGFGGFLRGAGAMGS